MKIGMQFGLMLGIVLIGISLIFYILHADLQSKLPQILSYGLMVAVLIIGIRSYRDQDLKGQISYGKSLGTGTLIALFGSVITAFYTYIFFHFIDPSMVDRILELSQQKMAERGGMTDEQVEMALNMSRKFMTPGWMFTFTILSYTFVGFVMSLIASAFLKRTTDNPFSSNTP